MASKYWLKLHHHILDDERFQEVSARTAWTWILCFAFAGERDQQGALQSTKIMAWRLRIPEDELACDLDALSDAGLLTRDEAGIWAIVGFLESQAPETDVGRMQQYRKRKQVEKWYPDKRSNDNGIGRCVTKGVTKRNADKMKNRRDEKKGDEDASRRRYLDYITK